MPSLHVADGGTARAEESGFTIGEGVERAAGGRPYERQSGDPPHRRFRIFTRDPSASYLEGSVAVVTVPFEPIEAGFRGHVFEVDVHDADRGIVYQALCPDDRTVLLADGCTPSPADPLFHQQMVYAVCMRVYAAFRTALGRDLAWGFERNGDAAGGQRLRLRPWAFSGEANAYYDRGTGELRFGYFRGPREARGPVPPHGLVFAGLSHDIVAHEVTHALLDGLRAHFAIPSGPDVLAFHEGFADLVAVFQRFSHRSVVEAAIAKSRGRIEDASLLTELASEVGQVLGKQGGLRTAVERDGTQGYAPDLEQHELGSVLVWAVFGAFTTVYARKVERFLRLATGGTGTLPPGEMPVELRSLLAEEASKLAEQFLTICIRALDYCPPIDIELGEFLRAVLTADRELVPDDPWGYREAWIDAFRRRRIFPPKVDFLAENALVWEPPPRPLEPIRSLAFAELRFAGDPARPADARELRRQAVALGEFVSRRGHLEVFGLASPGDPRLAGDRLERPRIQSVRSSRRVGPDGQVLFDLVAEVTQVRHVEATDECPAFDFVGGATVIVGPDGHVRYVVCKDVLHPMRLARQRDFLSSEGGRALWQMSEGRLVPVAAPFRLMHGLRG